MYPSRPVVMVSLQVCCLEERWDGAWVMAGAMDTIITDLDGEVGGRMEALDMVTLEVVVEVVAVEEVVVEVVVDVVVVMVVVMVVVDVEADAVVDVAVAVVRRLYRCTPLTSLLSFARKNFKMLIDKKIIL